MAKKFATAINCMDGRAQKPIIEYMLESFGIDYVDMITEPGPVKILSEGMDLDTIESIRRRVAISIEKHKSETITIMAHHDCAGNPASEDAQKEQLRKATKTILSWGFPAKKIIALWLDKDFKPHLTP